MAVAGGPSNGPWDRLAGRRVLPIMSNKEKQAQDAEQRLRDRRDRKTLKKGPPPQGEPRYRDGADRSGLGGQGWSEVAGEDEPPKGRG